MLEYKGELNRTMEFDSEQNYNIGDVVDLGIHWAKPEASCQDFLTGKKYTYNFHCENGAGMAIDYDNLTSEEEQEYETNEDAWQEAEVIVKDKKFEILSISGCYWEEFDGYMYDVEVRIA